MTTVENTTDLTLEILQRIQADLAAHRRETRAIQETSVDLARLVQRFDTRLSDVKSDLETMFKMEIIGQSAHLESRLETQIEQLLDKSLEQVVRRLDSIDGRLGTLEAK